MMRHLFFFLALCVFQQVSHATTTDSLYRTEPKFVVVLDAGHGGKDPGKYFAKTAEKDIALAITKKVGELLERHSDIKVVYTRRTDKFLELYQRADIANNAKADFFVSIHANAADARSAKGNETFVLGLHRNADNLEVVKRENAVILLEDNYEEKYAGFNPEDPSSFASMVLVQEEALDESLMMAAQIQKDFAKNIKRKNRGVKQAGLAVLRLTYMPSVLVEVGFVTNTEERNYLKTRKGQDDLSKSIYQSILVYKDNRDINEFVVETPDQQDSTVDKKSTYKVQIAASKNKLAAKSYNFKKLPNISREYDGGVYRYFTGYLPTVEKARELQREAISKGYSTAFVVQLQDGKRTRVK